MTVPTPPGDVGRGKKTKREKENETVKENREI
jgi:hypothetical protein